MNVALETLAGMLDKELSIDSFKDVSNNGLQIANNGTVTRVLAGVDASMRLLEEAAQRGADCVVCHHGLSWGDSLKRITGLNHRLVSFAIKNNIAVYAAHLPLDAQPVYGNNAQICKLLGLSKLESAFEYHGQKIGFKASFGKPMTLSSFCGLVRKRINSEIKLLDFGKPTIKTIGVVSGGAADMIDQASALGTDVYLTGEPSLQGYNLAEHLAINVVFAGHYATEKFGPRALSGLIKRRCKIQSEFVDFDIGY
ncbi:MAG: Nif3-like dinuclear metal center hexameric protein [Kiritimatiellae bacterium]|nr:Nif3-like dinuclear metal center hexameric protein [Kiritimatiellia bacterium]